MIKQTIYKKFVILTILITIFSLIFTSCSEYKKFTFRNDLVKCSFEYPSSFPKPGVDTTGDGDSISLGAKRTIFDSNSKPIIYTIFIIIMRSNESIPDSSTLLELGLNNIQRTQDVGEFEILNRSPLIISGASGEQLLYRYVGNIIDDNKFTTWFVYGAGFENNEILYDISLRINTSPELDMRNQVKADFEHIIKTFKILD